MLEPIGSLSNQFLSLSMPYKPFPLTLALALLITLGCSGKPSRIKAPRINPKDAAAEAMSLYDTSGDGVLDTEELQACPGVAAAVGAYDQDGDRLVSEQELVDRLAGRVEGRIGLTRLRCRIKVNGRPLEGAEITFEPEPYLGDEVKTAYGITDAGGSAAIAIPDEELPEAQRNLNALHMGTYKVRVTHPELEIPAKYNTETVLGMETESGRPDTAFDLEIRRQRRS